MNPRVSAIDYFVNSFCHLTWIASAVDMRIHHVKRLGI